MYLLCTCVDTVGLMLGVLDVKYSWTAAVLHVFRFYMLDVWSLVQDEMFSDHQT